ncbi:MAG: hypothetical protein HY513_01395 [Candidatus Aenigmarchaeota archaeon]|nr:hypothetical protein [Candidatus Aenigmarchaeota archaeon]
MFKVGYTEVRGKFYPIIELILEYNRKEIGISAIIDSGATLSVFDAKIAEKLNINLENGEKRVFQSATSKLIAYVHELEMTIVGHKFPCKIAFSNDLSTSFNLLGRETIFDKFLITFNERQKELMLDKVE